MAKNKLKKTQKQSGGAVALSLTKGFFTLLGRSILTLFMVLAITGSIVAVCILIIVLNLVKTDELVEISKDRLSYTSIMYAIDYETGENYELGKIYGKENREWVDLSQIPEDLQIAYISIEDKRFYNHNGVDFIRTTAAAINMVIPLWDGAVHGGSTIDQQLIKNITGEDAPRVERKVQEIFSAMNLDRNYSKADILEAYLNTISLGNNTNGVEAASKLYFGKSAIDLSLAECAMLAGITNNPTYYDPSRHFDHAKKRQGDILDAMMDYGYITEAELDKAYAEDINIVMDPEVQSKPVVMSYFQDHVINEVINDFMEMGYTKDEANSFIYTKGVNIYTTFDKRVQKILDEKYADYENTFANVINTEPVQSAFVVTDPNGKLFGMVGGTGTKDVSRSWNRASMSKRQPGSTIKAFTSYGLGIEYDLITFSSVFEDKELNILPGPGQDMWNVSNYYDGYSGRMTVDTALQRSTNTVAVQVQELVGIERATNFLENSVGISTLKEDDYAPSPMALGSLTDGVIPLEWAGAYQIYANGGTFTKPYSYTVITDNNGEVLLENNLQKEQVISKGTSMIMNQLLQDVVYGPSGTGQYAKNVVGTRVAGKTGTSNDDVDQWFVGMTPDYIGVVWLGYDRNKTVSYAGGYPPPIVWTKVMAEVQKLAPGGNNFPVTSDVVQLQYCTISGNLAADGCPTATGYYKSSHRPPVCTSHGAGGGDTAGNSEGGGSGIIFEDDIPVTPDEGSTGDGLPQVPDIDGFEPVVPDAPQVPDDFQAIPDANTDRTNSSSSGFITNE